MISSPAVGIFEFAPNTISWCDSPLSILSGMWFEKENKKAEERVTPDIVTQF
jgi:hypothetical protein